MRGGKLSDITMYGHNGTGPLERELEKATARIRSCEAAEQLLYTAVMTDCIMLVSGFIRLVRNLVSIIAGSVQLAKKAAAMAAASAAAGLATGGIGAAIGAFIGSALTARNIAHIAWTVRECIKRSHRVMKRTGRLSRDSASLMTAIDNTNRARELGHKIEQRLLAARMDSASFVKRILACKKRIEDHKASVVKYYSMLVKHGYIDDDDIIEDYCESHDNDKLSPFNLARQALRFVSDRSTAPDKKYLEMMKSVVEEHQHRNEHHPEYWSGEHTGAIKQNATSMPMKYIGEMCADWAAMAEEMGTSLSEWVNKVVNRKWMFTDEQAAMIRNCCDFLEPYTHDDERDYGYLYYDPGADKVWKTDIKEEAENMTARALVESPVPRQEILGAIHVLLNLIGEDGGLSDDSGIAIEDRRPEPIPAEVVDDGPYADSGVERSVDTEDQMNSIMDTMNVPPAVRSVAPQILNNVVSNPDGSYRSIDGSVDLDDGEKLKAMIAGTLNAISRVMARDGHSSVSIGEDLKAHVVTRDRFGHRREITVDPVED